MLALEKRKKLYTIVLDYKKNTYLYQLFAKDQKEAQLKWSQTVDLNKIGIANAKKIRNRLISDATNEDDYPALLNGLQSVWYASACTCNLTGEPGESGSAGANIIATINTEKDNEADNLSLKRIERNTLTFSRKKTLYTIQLDYEGGSYAFQVFADTPVDAKIQWIKEFDFGVVSGAPESMQEIKESLLTHAQDHDFIPNLVSNLDSVWSTFVPLGDERGRITIVATQTMVVSL